MNALLIAKAVRAFYDSDITYPHHRELLRMLSDDEFAVYWEVTHDA
jgi:hypothetical protein